ncbi:MAG: serine hydrolase, partial [Alphaproteobacteria bacterium]
MIGLSAMISVGVDTAEARKRNLHIYAQKVKSQKMAQAYSHRRTRLAANRQRVRQDTRMVQADSASPLFSSIVVDVNTGRTLNQNDPDGLRHPASVTKVMTLYLLFEQLQAGRVSLDTEFPVSQRAAAQAPSKLGLKSGSTITAEEAIKGLVTRSANDAAVVVAEA